jgi:hypothetical protein
MTAVPTQLQLPAVLVSLVDVLPATLPVSVPDGESAADNPPTEQPLSLATIQDLDAHLDQLGTQIAADTQRLRALTALRDQALANGAAPDSPVLTAVAPAQPHTGD